MENINKLATQRSVVIFSMSSCGMSYAVERLFRELGVNPTIHELDTIPNGKEIEKALARLVGRNRPVPAVFIGGKLVGPTDQVISLHVTGSLVPLLREAGAIWL